jgi:hypothetical protein
MEALARMSKWWLFSIAGMVALVASCSCCLWSLQEQLRFSQSFDIGHGRQLVVWSIRENRFPNVSVPMVYYCISRGNTEVVHQTFLDHDDRRDYRFNVAFADEGRLACVYEATRSKTNSYYLLIFDEASRESWPRLRDDESRLGKVVDKWRQRYRRLRAENPDLPTPEPFDK